LESITNNLPAIALVLAGIGLVVMIVMQSLQMSAMRRRLDQLTGGMGEGNLEDVLIAHLESVHTVGQELDELMARIAILESAARHHYARQGLVRFNPFPDTGGNQSFALALLDEGENGFIVSSLHSRTGTRIYAKAVINGKVDAALSTEETQAIEEARASRPARPEPASRGRAAVRESARAPKEAPAPAKAAPARASARPAAPAPEPVAPEPAVVPPAEPGIPSPAGDDSDNVVRPVAGKGQSKGELSAADDAAENTGARPGRS